MGVSGCGKTTIGKEMSKRLNIPFYDGDDFHPEENIEKMKSGDPLNDTDRRPWLEAINEFAREKVKETSLIVACSALKEKYRSILARNIDLQIVYLKGSAELILDRMNDREGHFMPPELLDSQFADLEEPVNAITVDIDQSIDAITSEVVYELLQQ